ncbi:hypothetical protein [Planktothricoides raciborskii]|uniref:Uncharacterized protein n=1 Tax=Planktothricoides raciborskii GIHE-MW2 TaxID=2792601 RepID=A0AAU8JAY3_9CYAN
MKIYALYREIDEETRFLKNPKFHPGMLRPNSRRNRVSVKIYALYREIDEETRFLKNRNFIPECFALIPLVYL